MLALIQFKDSFRMRDGMIGNLLESAPSHILKFHTTLLCRSRLRCDKFSREAGVRLSLFFTKEVVRFVAQSHGHLNGGAVSFFWGLGFFSYKLFSVRDN